MEVDNKVVNKNPGEIDENSSKKPKIGEEKNEEKTEAMDIESDDKSVASMKTNLMIQELLYMMAAHIEETVEAGYATKTIDKLELDEIRMAIKQFEVETGIPMKAVHQDGWKDKGEKQTAQEWIVARKTAKKMTVVQKPKSFAHENAYHALAVVDDDDIEHGIDGMWMMKSPEEKKTLQQSHQQ